jgi:MFS family permease
VQLEQARQSVDTTLATHDDGAKEATRLSELTPRQWRSGTAAWLGWLFDGLDMHLYTLVAAPVVLQLIGSVSNTDPGVKEKSAYIQAAFLLGWALGGSFFGRLGDILGRSRALSLTILTYATCTGLCAFAQTWWQLMLFRFIAALGIGGEWAVGASLLSETWPKAWRPWIAAMLQTGVNLGILGAAIAVGVLSLVLPPHSERFVFLVGVLPAFLVFWIRRHVPEPETWQRERDLAVERPRARELFGPAVSWLCAMGTMPVRLTRPSVGLMPTTELLFAGETMEPSVSVPTATAARLAATAAPDPELEPDGLRSSAYGLRHCPPRPLQPEVECVERKFAHSDRLVFPSITAPARRRRAATAESLAGFAPTSASDPAVVCIRSEVATLSLTSTGIP